MIPAIASHIPLVRRAKAPALPLEERLTHLTGLTVAPAGASHHDLVSRTCGVLNYAALIASDVGMTDLATDLCWRQHQAFADAGRLSGSVAVMSLMPLVNLSRLLTRSGSTEAAYEVLTQLYRAAQQRSAAVIQGRTVDLAALTHTEEDHRTVCKELWTALLVDGARAQARSGRWTQAAEAMAQHRGIGNRLLDGRQIKIMSLMERGLDQQARDTINATQHTEPWETTIAQLLRLHCRPADTAVPRSDIVRLVTEITAEAETSKGATAVFHTRTGLATLTLTEHPQDTGALIETLAHVAASDAHAARELLQHSLPGAGLATEQRRCLEGVVSAAGLGARLLPAHHARVLADAASRGEAALHSLLNPAARASPRPSLSRLRNRPTE